MIDHLKRDYSVTVVCRTLGVSRSSYYAIPVLNAGDEVLLSAIDQVFVKGLFYGYRKVTRALKRMGCQVGETRVRRLLKQIEHHGSMGKAPDPASTSR